MNIVLIWSPFWGFSSPLLCFFCVLLFFVFFVFWQSHFPSLVGEGAGRQSGEGGSCCGPSMTGSHILKQYFGYVSVRIWCCVSSVSMAVSYSTLCTCGVTVNYLLPHQPRATSPELCVARQSGSVFCLLPPKIGGAGIVCLFYLRLNKKNKLRVARSREQRWTSDILHPNDAHASFRTRHLPSCNLCRFLWCSSAICRAAPVIASSSPPNNILSDHQAPLLSFSSSTSSSSSAIPTPHTTQWTSRPLNCLSFCLFVCLCHSVGNKASIAEAVYV